MPDSNRGDCPDYRAFFSDTTEDYVSPCEPDLYDKITIRLRVGREQAQSCFLVTEKSYLYMRKTHSDSLFDYYAVQFEITVSPLRYYFEIIACGRRYRYTRRGVRNTIRPADFWHIIPGFHTPAWARGAVMYQIFVDRFCNGDPSNDVLTGEFKYYGSPVVRVEDWNQPPTTDGFREFYGGDLQGVIDKLDYLESLGVEAIYFNPIFLSPSSHKYDTQDYEHIDPHFGKIVHDKGELLYAKGSVRTRRTNRKASRYIDRVTNPANLEASDRLFARLVKKAHEHGIRVILDGVFNHCGSFHRWLDAEKIYEQLPSGNKGARASKRSPYTEVFRFERDEWPSNDSFDAWWRFDTLPKLNYENSEKLCQYILDIGKKWVSPPYNADGWRLDVAADLGYSPEFNHHFWERFRKAVKKAIPDATALAENYTDSQDWLQGKEWDTIMNYEFFMEPVTFFLTGMEKHSDAQREEYYGDPDTFWRAVLYMNQDAMPDAALRISMNELSNHDHSRFLTRTNRIVGRAHDLGTEAAMTDVNMQVMRQAVLLQMTWTGAPTIYYGDEAGLGGFTDPDNRRTYPWGHEDQELLRYHKILTSIRRGSHTLRCGSILRLPDADGLLAYARFTGPAGASRAAAAVPGAKRRGNMAPRAARSKDEAADGSEAYIILININHISINYRANVTYAGIPAGAELRILLRTDRSGFTEGISEDGEPASVVLDDRILRINLPPESGILLHWSGN